MKCANLLTFYVQDDEEEEEEDFKIKPGDNLIVAGHVDQDFSTLEISGESHGETGYKM